MGARNCYYRKAGQVTPAQFNIDCYHYRGQPIILDDAEGPLDSKLGASLIGALGDASAVESLSYGTTSRALGDVPQRYVTTSPLCVLTNRTTKHEAIQSRARILFADPTNLEVHRAVTRWFWDQEIHDWFGQHRYRLPPLDARWYLIAHRDKQAGWDWRQILLATHSENRATCLVQDLEGDPAYPTREDKARRSVELMGDFRGASRPTYFRVRLRLEGEHRLIPESIAPIVLRRTRLPGIPSLAELEALEVPLTTLPEEEPRQLDLPVPEAFTQPIRGSIPSQAPPPRPILDDRLPWERPPQMDDEDDES
jgi:hypothetical protein